MTEFQDLLGIRAPQDIDDVARAEELAGPLDAGEEHLRRDGEIDEVFSLSQPAVVAHAATVRNAGLAEIVSRGTRRQRSVSANPRSGLRRILATRCSCSVFLSDEVLDLLEIPVAEQQETMGGQTVPSGPADLLVVVVDAPGQVVMDDKPDIGLVDPHAEGDRRHDDPDIVAAEALLVLGALLLRQTRMVGADGIALPLEGGVEIVRLPAGGAVDDARFVRILPQAGPGPARGARSSGPPPERDSAG